jgi:hypothetical protein
MARAGLVAHDGRRRGGLQRRRQRLHRVLVDRAELVFLAVGALQAERLGLLSSTSLGDLEASGELVEVEHGRLDRRAPEIPIMVAEEQPVQPAGVVLRSGGHPHGVRVNGRLSARLRREVAGRNAAQENREPEGPPGGPDLETHHVTNLHPHAYLR